ncbi:hypothetical protein QP027_08125 [Corynebacterium breve]|uniref:Uncharacterized protein n=1 Tax=Corynebacterium breve TaxID=3049799 RepID=A0ABY8VBP6_9CORY|nr:hypothetical protein [Corynebacterium breve]WIM67091.1 hypothetical protein QP027_08125 [Corynebacterium breve]
MSTRQTSPRSTTPAIVARRNLLILAADGLSGLIILAAVINFISVGWGFTLWVVGTIGASFSMFALRSQVQKQDIREGELDEYQLDRLHRARRSGFTVAMVGLMFVTVVLWALPAVRLLDLEDPFTMLTELIRAAGYLATAFLVRVPFAVTRLIASEVNRDELISHGRAV